MLHTRSFVRPLAALSMAAVLSGCTTEPSTPADPAGTVTTALRSQSNGAFLIDFDAGATFTQNTNNTADMYLDAALNFNALAFPAARKIADVGAVSGLGAVTAVPTAGFVTAN